MYNIYIYIYAHIIERERGREGVRGRDGEMEKGGQRQRQRRKRRVVSELGPHGNSQGPTFLPTMIPQITHLQSITNFVYDCTCARSFDDRTRLLCPVFFLPESARGPRHLVTRPGPLPLPLPDACNRICTSKTCHAGNTIPCGGSQEQAK